MDEVDQRLVAALRVHGRASWAELGRSVGLSGPSVADRVARLEQSGVIAGYTAVVSPEALGWGVTALIGVYLSDAGDQDQVADDLGALAEVEDCWFVAGEESFVLKVRAADMRALEQTLSRLRRLVGVSRTRTTVVLSTKWEGRFPAPSA